MAINIKAELVFGENMETFKTIEWLLDALRNNDGKAVWRNTEELDGALNRLLQWPFGNRSKMARLLSTDDRLHGGL